MINNNKFEMSAMPPGVSQAFLKKQAEIQQKLESDVTEIKKIEQGRENNMMK